MSYYKLPTKSKQVVTVITIVLCYGFVFFSLNYKFSDLDESTKRFLNQFGLMVIFVSALLASIGIFWSEKVRHNKELAEKEILDAESTISILNTQIEQLGVDLSLPLKANESKLSSARQQLIEIDSHPDFIRFSGHFSILVLAIGTMMCIIGAG